MNKFIKQVIEEKFVSKKQQKFFYAKSSDKSLPKKERKKWKKWANEFSKDTDFEKIPEKVEKDIDEIVDEKGNIKRSKKPTDFNTKGITQKKTTDDVVNTAAGSMGTHGVHGTHTSLRYWAEADMSKSLGYDETLGKDVDIKQAKNHFKKDLGLSDDETEERLEKMGYDEDLPKEKVRLVENPKKFIEEYIDNILSKRTNNHDFVNKDKGEINPIVKRQLMSLKNSLKNNDISLEDVINFFKEDE